MFKVPEQSESKAKVAAAQEEAEKRDPSPTGVHAFMSKGSAFDCVRPGSTPLPEGRVIDQVEGAQAPQNGAAFTSPALAKITAAAKAAAAAAAKADEAAVIKSEALSSKKIFNAEMVHLLASRYSVFDHFAKERVIEPDSSMPPMGSSS
jgi:hypothetical protein